MTSTPTAETRLQRRGRRFGAKRRTTTLQPVLTLLALVALPALIPVQAAELRLADLADLTLEQLANIEVTSVSRHSERLADAPASIYVITNDDVRRSGARTLG